MAKTIDPGLVAKLREESERTKDLPFPEGVRPMRPMRKRWCTPCGSALRNRLGCSTWRTPSIFRRRRS